MFVLFVLLSFVSHCLRIVSGKFSDGGSGGCGIVSCVGGRGVAAGGHDEGSTLPEQVPSAGPDK